MSARRRWTGSQEAVRTAPPAQSKRRLAQLGLAAAVVLVLAVRMVAIEPMRIDSDSMAPTLSAGEHVVIDKLRYRGSGPQPGELAAFDDPRSDDVMLKRVVAVSGDVVGLEDGVLVINGRRHAEAYVDRGSVDGVYFGPVTVPPRAVFVLGDNRGNSVDSRDFGSVSLARLIGPVAARIWPPQRWGTPA